MMAGVLQTIFSKKNAPGPESDSRLLRGLPLGFATAYILYVLGACAHLAETVLSVSALAVVAILTYAVMKLKSEVPLVIQLCVALCALNLKIVTTQGNLLILVLLNLVAMLLVFQRKIDFLLAIVSIIIFKKFDFGPYIVSDLFHSSEYVISYQHGLNAFGEWHVFPNIGYLEEVIPNFIVDVISISSQGYFQISIQDAYSLSLILLTGGMYYFLEKKWKGIAYALTMLIAVERLTLMLVINLGLGLSALRSYYLVWAVIGVVPLLMLGLSPSYGAVFVLSLALYLWKHKPAIKLLSVAVVVGTLCILFYADTFIYYLTVYKDWGSVNSAAHGTPMWSAPMFKSFLRLAFVLSLSLLIWQIIKDGVFNIYGCIALAGIALSLWMYLSYGFTRLDKDTGSRIFSVGLAMFVGLLPYLDRYTKAVPALLLISFFGASFATPQPIAQIDLMRHSPKMTLDAESHQTLKQYKSVAQQLGGDVILFGNQPTLAHYISSAKVPPFSSPWVAIGKLPQEKVIDYLKGNPTAPILIGESFLSWDRVDVRARSPIIYQYIAQHYREVVINDVIVAVPTIETNKSELFSGFDIGEGAAYYAKTEHQMKVVVPCEQGNVGVTRYRVNNEKNYFYATLTCGVNLVPNVYFSGLHLNVVKVQAN